MPFADPCSGLERPIAPDLADFAPFLSYVHVVHHVPGRLRLRLPRATETWLGGQDPGPWLRQLEACPGVRGVRLNAAAASLILDYDPAHLPPSWWSHYIGEPDRRT